jgi:hypothetical protein
MLKKLLSPTGVAAEFEVDTLRISARKLEDRWVDERVKMPVRLPSPGTVTDLWSEQSYGRVS